MAGCVGELTRLARDEDERMPDSERRKPPSLLHQFVLLLAVTVVVLVGGVRFGLVEWWAYAVERGRLRALRENIRQTVPADTVSLSRTNMLAAVIPAVVSIEADLSADRLRGPRPPASSDPPGTDPSAPSSPSSQGDSATPDSPSLSDAPSDSGADQGWGSGFVIDAEAGHVVTNAHVIFGAAGVRVHTADGRVLPSVIVGIDAETDLAVVKVEPDRLHALPLGDSDGLSVGQEVLAVGSPFGLDQTVTQGIVSALERRGIRGGSERYARLIQTDAAISPGSSGGPLLNLRGEVIGINTAIIAPSGQYQGVGFAIPASVARGILPDLISGGPAFLGVLVWNATDPAGRDEVVALGWTESYGAVVDEVYAGTGAAEAGLRVNDIILSVAGERIRSIELLGEIVRRHKPGDTIDLTILRDHTEQTITMKLSRRYAPR